MTPPEPSEIEAQCCADWPVQIELINSYISLQAIRSGEFDQFLKRGGKQFKFCPWCGKARPIHEAIRRDEKE